MNDVAVIGLDLVKSVFQVHGVGRTHGRNNQYCKSPFTLANGGPSTQGRKR